MLDFVTAVQPQEETKNKSGQTFNNDSTFCEIFTFRQSGKQRFDEKTFSEFLPAINKLFTERDR